MDAANAKDRNAILNGLALRRLIRNGVLICTAAVFVGVGLVIAFASESSVAWAIYGTFFIAAWFFLLLGGLFLSMAKCPRCGQSFHSRGFYTNHFSSSCLSCKVRLDGTNLPNAF